MKKINAKKAFLVIVVIFALMFKYWSIWEFFSDSIKFVFFGLSVIFSIISIFVNKYTKKEIRNIFLLFILSIIICYSTGEIDFIYSFLLAMIFMKEKNGDYLFVKYYAISGTILFLATIIFWKLGITDTYKSVRLIDGILIQRNSLGFEHVNAVFKNFFPICLCLYMLFYKKKKNHKILLYFILIVVGYLLYLATNSRTGYYVIILIAPLDFLFEKIKDKYDFNISKYFFLIFSIATIIITFIYGTTNNVINELLSNRPILYYKVITQSNISLFGDLNKGMVDNTYLWLVYHRGLIVYITYLLIYIFATKKIIKNKIFVIPLLLFCLYSTLENLDVYNYNFLLIIQLIALIKNNNIEYKWIENINTKGGITCEKKT